MPAIILFVAAASVFQFRPRLMRFREHEEFVFKVISRCGGDGFRGLLGVI